MHSKNECSKLTLFLFSVQLQRKMELITMMIRYIPTILMFPICLPVFFLFTQTTWFYLSCQFLSHTVNFFKFDKTGRVEGSLTGFFFRISLRQGFHLILHNGDETIMKLHFCVFFKHQCRALPDITSGLEVQKIFQNPDCPETRRFPSQMPDF